MTAHRKQVFDVRKPLTPHTAIRVGAYENGALVQVIPCSDETEASAIGKALEAQGFQVRLRAGASLPETLAGDSE